jgi:hypothetical protein
LSTIVDFDNVSVSSCGSYSNVTGSGPSQCENTPFQADTRQWAKSCVNLIPSPNSKLFPFEPIMMVSFLSYFKILQALSSSSVGSGKPVQYSPLGSWIVLSAKSRSRNWSREAGTFWRNRLVKCFQLLLLVRMWNRRPAHCFILPDL